MTSGLQILEGLNPNQREAVEATDGPLLIVAGPGSGKTRVITHRIAHLVRNFGIRPYRVAAVTFTNKAAREMGDRLQRLVGPDANALAMGTFHSFCARLLRQDGHSLGLDPNFSIYDTDDQLGLIKQAMELAEIDPRQNHPRAVLGTISRAKSVLMDSQGLARQAQLDQDYFEELCAKVYHNYEELLGRNNAVDFDDLLLKAVHLLRDYPEVQVKYHQRYQYLMVDEFQDTNVAQYRLARLLTADHENICVVGDPDQSIYSWRNADIRNILSFQRDYPRARVIALEQNYRSSATILEASKQLISTNGMRVEIDLFTDNPKGAPVTVHEAYDEAEEASFVVSEIDRLIRQEERKHGDCAVMYRVNAQSRALEEACLRQGIKYRLVGGIRFYQRKEVKDLMAYLHLLYNPQDEINLRRVVSVPPRGIGARTMQQLVEWSQRNNLPLFAAMQNIAAARQAGQPSPVNLGSRAINSIARFADNMTRLIELASQIPIVDLIDRTMEDSGLRNHIQNSDDHPDERWENIMEFRETAREFDTQDPPDGLASLLERASLVSQVDSYEDSDESITLITLHQAKGLEFPVVFIVGLEEGLLPHSRSMDSEEELEEERRLCYVGFTRAEERLYLLRAFRRGLWGSSGPTLASRFLREVPPELVASPRPANTERKARTALSSLETWKAAAAPAPSRTTLKVGDSVRHLVFGEGVVTGFTPTGDDHEVTVQFAEGVGLKRLLASFAPLENLEG